MDTAVVHPHDAFVRRLVVVLIAVFASCARDTAPPGASKRTMSTTIQAGVLTVGSDMAYAPFESVDQETQKPVGFDVDLVTEIGRRNRLEVRFVNQTFSGVIAGLLARRYDAVASAMTITEDRRKQIAFSDAYLGADQSLVVPPRSPITSTDALSGRTVGVQTHTSGESWATEHLTAKVKSVKSYQTIDDAFVDLKSGKIDAVVNDIPASLYRQKVDPGAFKVVQQIDTDEQYGIAIHPDNALLLAQVNAALGAIRADGTYGRIYETWFGRKPGA